MNDCRERVMKRLNLVYKTSVWSGLAFILFSGIVSLVSCGIAIGSLVFAILIVVMLLAFMPTAKKNKKAMQIVADTDPVICTVIRKNTRNIGGRKTRQAAYFIYNDKECFGLDYDKSLDEIKEGQKLYVWQISNKHYEIAHIDN